eukprot:TRINITY_DN17928_c0_g1_i3.p2 TRINITY_DN17928_c0_g1~~TRINITY_DN17928_c0_g1_i3.p2  ORF type:complete len:105 (-),score=21.51 TRINITY_DN17928_c0_g1_i3:170-484(-)
MFSIIFFFFFQAEDGIRDAQESRGLGDVYKRQMVRVRVRVGVGVGVRVRVRVRYLHPSVLFNLCTMYDLENDQTAPSKKGILVSLIQNYAPDDFDMSYLPISRP